MSQLDPGFDPHGAPAVTFPVAVRRPGTVTAAAVAMLLLAVVGLVASMVALIEHVTRSLQVSPLFDFELQQNLLALALCIVIGLLALGVWSGSSPARLVTFAALGIAVTVAASRTVGHLAGVLYGIDTPYEEPWRGTLVLMWLYLLGTVVLAVPIVLLNRSSATRWFRDHRPRARLTADLDATNAPPALFLARTVMGTAVMLTVFHTLWTIFELAVGTYVKPDQSIELIVRSLAAATVPLLILTAAIVEAGSGSRLGQVAAFMAGGYALYQGYDAVYSFIGGMWLESLQQLGDFLTTAALGVAGAVVLLLLLRPPVVDHFARNAVVIDLGAALAEEAALAEDEDEDEDEPDDTEADPDAKTD